ncbi:MAG: flagellar basal body-associated FliL family protein [Alphaproteobacteria bacterium]|nr:flagellar basal body-associated FliL family protein [Alphaproteobacteria bacterium]MCK5518740.1 flagellar basal body-associated FliL family protein [Alphaproteobacteria bacterium]MCK5555076.1 flagellar basal body-associated FliL family protein [Alphaproteobacteria bacterium]MCK5658789.1 flagellar basal body-associated FliL family protein [Alphaproteobacteria bacterium]
MAKDKKAKKDDKPKDDKDSKDSKGIKDAEEKTDDEESIAEGEGDAEVSHRFTTKKILLFIVIPLILIITLGSGAYFLGFLDKIFPKDPLACENVKEGDKDFAECTEQAAAENANFPGTFLTMEDIIVNLNSAGKQPRFLKIAVKLEMEDAEEQKKIEPLMPRVVDQFQMYLRELRVSDLRGTSGIYRMKIELLNRVRAVAPNVKVRDVLFQEILVQ